MGCRFTKIRPFNVETPPAKERKSIAYEHQAELVGQQLRWFSHKVLYCIRFVDHCRCVSELYVEYQSTYMALLYFVFQTQTTENTFGRVLRLKVERKVLSVGYSSFVKYQCVLYGIDTAGVVHQGSAVFTMRTRGTHKRLYRTP
jgi:hypothetical protein